MPIKTTDQEIGARPLTPIFFLVDTSGSMVNDPIEAVNAAMRQAIPEIKNFAQENADSSILVNVLEFSTGVNWMSEKPVNVEDFNWYDLKASGLTAMGAAFGELNNKLSRKAGGFLQEHANNAPIIVLLTDGAPTDDAQSELEDLKKNKWFSYAIKIAIELPGAIHSSLVEFVGSEEGVIPTDTNKLKELLKVIAVNSAKIGSQSSTRGKANTAASIVKPVKPEVEIPEPQPEPDPTDSGDIFDDGQF
jgi:uncharacterized protein YegL